MDCRSARLYAISEYKEIENFFQSHKGNAKATSNVALLANHFGAMCTPDAQGRVALPDLLREKLRLDGADVYLYFYKNRFELFTAGQYNARLDEAMPGFGWRTDPTTGERMPIRLRILGATVGPSLLVTSLIFALGHFATIREPARLAVFFPSLLFGWLRYRTKGVGAGIAFHATCNVFSELLGKGFRVY